MLCQWNFRLLSCHTLIIRFYIYMYQWLLCNRICNNHYNTINCFLNKHKLVVTCKTFLMVKKHLWIRIYHLVILFSMHTSIFWLIVMFELVKFAEKLDPARAPICIWH